jgi:hypothetical protein
MAEAVIDIYKPDVIVSYLDPGVEVSKAGKHYMQKLDDTARKGGTVLCFADQFPGVLRNNYEGEALHWIDGRGILSFATNGHELGAKIKEWSDEEDRFTAPCSIADVTTKDMPTLIERIKMWKVAEEALTAFPA